MTKDVHDREPIITECEMNAEVFVPAGDGEPAKWKRMGDLFSDEMRRYAQGVQEAAVQYCKRADRLSALCNAAILDSEEQAELSQLHMLIAAQDRESEKREAAKDRDIAAGRYWVRRR